MLPLAIEPLSPRSNEFQHVHNLTQFSDQPTVSTSTNAYVSTTNGPLMTINHNTGLAANSISGFKNRNTNYEQLFFSFDDHGFSNDRVSKQDLGNILNVVRHSHNGHATTKHRPIRSQQNHNFPSIQYRLGAALPFNERWSFSKLRVWGAGELAIERVEAMRLLPPNNLTILYRDTKCDEAMGMNEAINFIVIDRVSALLGLVCDFSAAPVARQVTFWNLPLVSVGAMARDFLVRRRKVYPQLTRASPVDLNSFVEAFYHITMEYNWTKIKVLYSRKGQNVVPACCFLIADTFVRSLPPLGINVDYFEINDGVPVDKILLNEVAMQYGGK